METAHLNAWQLLSAPQISNNLQLLLHLIITRLLLIGENQVKMERTGYSFTPRWHLLPNEQCDYSPLQDNLSSFPAMVV